MTFKRILLLLGCAVLLSGCTKSQIVAPEDGTRAVDKPDFETKADVQLDWEQIGEDLDSIYTDEGSYPMCSGEDAVNFDIDQENKIVNINLFVKPEATKEDAVAYATAVIKGMNDEIAVQDFSVEKASETSYGSYYKDKTVNITVIAGTPMSGGDLYLVEQTIEPGSDAPIQAK